MGVSTEVCKHFLEKQNPIFKWKQNLMPSTDLGRSELLTWPSSPQSSLNSVSETPLRPLPGPRPLRSPSVFSSTVLCFTKATSPAPSARHLQRRQL